MSVDGAARNAVGARVDVESIGAGLATCWEGVVVAMEKVGEGEEVGVGVAVGDWALQAIRPARNSNGMGLVQLVTLILAIYSVTQSE